VSPLFGERGIELKTPAQLETMRRAGLVVGETLELLAVAVAPGVTTAELDALAEETIRASGAVPSFLGYHGFGQRGGGARDPRRRRPAGR
jgi:methionyl aminopeptidase